MTSPRVTRWIRGFDKVRENLVVQYRLPDSWTLERLQHLFGVPPENPMYDSFPVDERTAKILEPSVGSPLLIDTLDFFVEADAVKA